MRMPNRTTNSAPPLTLTTRLSPTPGLRRVFVSGHPGARYRKMRPTPTNVRQRPWRSPVPASMTGPRSVSMIRPAPTFTRSPADDQDKE